jgi:hypothetical protein
MGHHNVKGWLVALTVNEGCLASMIASEVLDCLKVVDSLGVHRLVVV